MSEKIEKQAVMVSKVLFALSETGIEPQHLIAADLCRNEEDHGLFNYAVQWLKREGLISFERRASPLQFRGCTLRAKGFAVLGMEIDFQGGKLLVSEAVEQVSSSGVVASVAGDFLGGLAGGFFKSIHS